MIVPPGLSLPLASAVLDHGERDAVLDRSAGIGALGLDPHLGVGKQLGEADVRRVADRREDVRGLHAAFSSSRGLSSSDSGGSKVRARAQFGEPATSSSSVTSIAPMPPATTAGDRPDQRGEEAALGLAQLVRARDEQARDRADAAAHRRRASRAGSATGGHRPRPCRPRPAPRGSSERQRHRARQAEQPTVASAEQRRPRPAS